MFISKAELRLLKADVSAAKSLATSLVKQRLDDQDRLQAQLKQFITLPQVIIEIARLEKMQAESHDTLVRSLDALVTEKVREALAHEQIVWHTGPDPKTFAAVFNSDFVKRQVLPKAKHATRSKKGHSKNR